ncbi:hypothetical protein IJJ02_02890 [Candidatus Saccharibacteria bacterium]|nr:hypothetical protein [Candidatus Saccharibacteria bacterium]
MSAEKKKQLGVLGLIVALIVVLFGGLLFMGAVSGWFDDPKVVLSEEYKCTEGCEEFMELDAAFYEDLVKAGKSFVVFVDQDGCTTADRLRGYVLDWASSVGVKVYRMMFSEVKKTSLHDYVKYYPSVAIVDKGMVRGYLRADSDEDADAYNDYDTFSGWIQRYL